MTSKSNACLYLSLRSCPQTFSAITCKNKYLMYMWFLSSAQHSEVEASTPVFASSSSDQELSFAFACTWFDMHVKSSMHMQHSYWFYWPSPQSYCQNIMKCHIRTLSVTYFWTRFRRVPVHDSIAAIPQENTSSESSQPCRHDSMAVFRQFLISFSSQLKRN